MYKDKLDSNKNIIYEDRSKIYRASGGSESDWYFYPAEELRRETDPTVSFEDFENETYMLAKKYPMFKPNNFYDVVAVDPTLPLPISFEGKYVKAVSEKIVKNLQNKIIPAPKDDEGNDLTDSFIEYFSSPQNLLDLLSKHSYDDEYSEWFFYFGYMHFVHDLLALGIKPVPPKKKTQDSVNFDQMTDEEIIEYYKTILKSENDRNILLLANKPINNRILELVESLGTKDNYLLEVMKNTFKVDNWKQILSVSSLLEDKDTLNSFFKNISIDVVDNDEDKVWFTSLLEMSKEGQDIIYNRDDMGYREIINILINVGHEKTFNYMLQKFKLVGFKLKELSIDSKKRLILEGSDNLVNEMFLTALANEKFFISRELTELAIDKIKNSDEEINYPQHYKEEVLDA